MLPTKFHGNQTTGSGDVRRGLNIYWRDGHQGQVTNIIFIIFSFPCTKNRTYKIGRNGPVVSVKGKSKFDFK